jgi:hypothetical protein
MDKWGLKEKWWNDTITEDEVLLFYIMAKVKRKNKEWYKDKDGDEYKDCVEFNNFHTSKRKTKKYHITFNWHENGEISITLWTKISQGGCDSEETWKERNLEKELRLFKLQEINGDEPFAKQLEYFKSLF